MNFIKKILLKINIFFKPKQIINLNENNNISFFKNVEFKSSKIDIYSYIANNSIIHNTEIGKFCSIGPNAVIGFGDHPTNMLSTSPVFYSSDCSFDLKPLDNLYYGKKKVHIGNDVWIGANVFIKNGITIGDGAIIGAGAVILKNIPAYAIVVGVPGVVKSYRFSQSTIRNLLSIKWWDLSPKVIRENFELFTSDKIIENLELISRLK
ncbi:MULTISPECIES: CatB-related O-acetyltransferase [unclassified Flavobacterium]|uniref:CatB-related O-acetyltransferase n=1 Tax=unclassified Flavobacterium TaxID=196869 RepID=UPI000F826953|nr:MULTISPECIES: CatB-related O-acetyltransferase [unclassified Flavobacterium]RTY71269.1 CatB-related O-acetyltransferase [Flavobacterium sp. LB2P53]RTY76865.1 CatB-related O-acetyltransferase [Flavobacterium sp. LS1R10]RTY95471.1 CatB-related O-acetyltransferase [Flavobacterium sp. GSN2]